MIKIDISNLNRSVADREKITDSYGIHKNPVEQFMAIRIMEPVIGGDTNGDGTWEISEVLKSTLSTGQEILEDGSTVLRDLFGLDNGGDPTGTVLNENANEDGFLGTIELPTSEVGGQNSFNVGTKSVAELALPLPLEISYEESANWADDNSAASDLALAGAAQVASLLSSGKGALGTLLDAVSATSALSAARKIGQKNFGVGLEPRKEMYYDGPVFREFTFNWQFSPKNQAEAQRIRDTVNALRKYTYPFRLNDTVTTLGFEVWRLPATYEIQFRLGDEENPYLPRLKACVISAINWNPTSEGQWRSFEDGAPIVSTLSISFKEIEVLTQKDIDGGY